MFEGLSDPVLYEFIDEEPPISVEALGERYHQLQAGAPQHLNELWLNWIVRSRSDSAPLGTVQDTVDPGSREASIAYVFFVSAWRNGYATEAVRWLIGHLVDSYSVVRVTAEIDKANIRSIALAKRCGLALVPDAPSEPGEVVMSLTAARWRSR